MNDFKKYATKHLGINSNALDKYESITSSYISPVIIEERKDNMASMDVFSRLMMDRIIFLGTPIVDFTANIVQAQLLYLESMDSGKDISIYINSPGGSVYAGYGIYLSCCLSRMCRSRHSTIGWFSIRFTISSSSNSRSGS